MAFADAKQPRPVEDPSALVAFGWAPGEYHRTACSDCRQSHSGTDKRSSRCQDCAEKLRDNPPPPLAPMTAVDHAELKRLAEGATPGPPCWLPTEQEDLVYALVEALKTARSALHHHYVEWDGEPEDVVSLQLARAECDRALAKAKQVAHG